MTRKKKTTKQQAKRGEELRDEELKDVSGGHAPAVLADIEGEATDKDHKGEIDVLP